MTNVALYLDASNPEIARRHSIAMLRLCMTRGWTPVVACRTVDDVAAALAAGKVRIVVAVSPRPGLVEAVAAAGGILEVVRSGSAQTTVPPGLAVALGEMVRAGRLSPDDAAVLLHAAGPGREPAADVHRRPRRPA